MNIYIYILVRVKIVKYFGISVAKYNSARLTVRKKHYLLGNFPEVNKYMATQIKKSFIIYIVDISKKCKLIIQQFEL